MSDWGAAHGTVSSALAGLDQESAYLFDARPYYGAALRTALADGRVSASRLDEMARRILRSIFAVGLADRPIEPDANIDFAADRAVAEADEQRGIVLLKNADGILLLASTVRRVLVIGGHADRGVLSGGGSSLVEPVGGSAVQGTGPSGWPGPVVYLPSPPGGAMMGMAPQARIRYVSGRDIAQAVLEAKWAARVVVFATQWATESEDVSLTLPGDQDRLIEAVARANPHTVVVLETDGPVLMPWLGQVAGLLEAWYPGSGGGETIARVLFGAADPSGHLPVSFPASLSELSHPQLPGAQLAAGKPFDVHYTQGAAVGYKWYQKEGLKPLFAFGYGLSYTRFRYSALSTRVENGQLMVSFTVSNTGRRAGAAVAQVYVGAKAGSWEAPRAAGGLEESRAGPGCLEGGIGCRRSAAAGDFRLRRAALAARRGDIPSVARRLVRGSAIVRAGELAGPGSTLRVGSSGAAREPSADLPGSRRRPAGRARHRADLGVARFGAGGGDQGSAFPTPVECPEATGRPFSGNWLRAPTQLRFG